MPVSLMIISSENVVTIMAATRPQRNVNMPFVVFRELADDLE
jgi:hypothetical protein